MNSQKTEPPSGQPSFVERLERSYSITDHSQGKNPFRIYSTLNQRQQQIKKLLTPIPNNGKKTKMERNNQE